MHQSKTRVLGAQRYSHSRRQEAANWQTNDTQGHGPRSRQVPKVEQTNCPRIILPLQVHISPETQNGAIAHRLLVKVLKDIGDEEERDQAGKQSTSGYKRGVSPIFKHYIPEVYLAKNTPIFLR